MRNFFVGMAAGLVAGSGLLLAVHPMSKREMRKVYRRAGKMMHKVNCSLHRNPC